MKACGVVGFPLLGHFCSTAVANLQNIITSFMGIASLSAFRLATRIVDGLAGLLANKVVVVVMPMIMHNIATNDRGRRKRSMPDSKQARL